MKNVLRFFALAAVAAAMVSCSGNKQYGESIVGIEQSNIDSASYSLGVSMGLSLRQSGIEPVNMASLYDGLADAVFGNELKVNQMDIPEIIQTYMMKCNIALGTMKAREQEAFLPRMQKKTVFRQRRADCSIKSSEREMTP